MQLIPYFQPIVDISTARVAGHEALARMVDHQGVVRSAGQIFCDTTLDEQQVLAFDRAVRLQALQRFAEAGQPGFLTVNIQPRWIDILADEWVPTVAMMELYDIAPHKVIIEIVEAPSQSDRLESIVAHYKALGMQVAVDDFGAGSSQFDRVVKLAPDIIKLDMRLFKEAVHGGFPQHIVQSLSFLAERMGSQLLCEGVEDYSELRFALEIGSKLVQGFMFSQAMPTFVNEGCFGQDIAIQRKRFLLEGIRKEEMAVTSSQRINEQIQRLADALEEKALPEQTDLALLDQTMIASLFICDIGGTQLSPTYRQQSGEWYADQDQLGTNWCWRPYFYQLLSSAETMKRQSITSRQYHDAFTGELVKTAARFIGGGRVLMVDIRARDQFLALY